MDVVHRTAAEAVDRLLQCILDPQRSLAPNGIVQELETLPPELRDKLFPIEEGSCTPIERVKDLLPAACEIGDLETVIWLLFYGANPYAKGHKGSPLEVATLYGQNEIVEKLIDWNQDILGDQDAVISCLMKACEGQHNDLIKAWLGHLNNICLYQEPWSNFARATPGSNVVNGFVLRLPMHNIQQLPEKIVQKLGQNIPRILEVWVINDDDEIDDERLRAIWSNRKLQSFEETWLQRPRYNANLVSIDLSHNALKTVPALLLWGLPWLEYFDLSDNKISDLPDLGQGDPEQLGLVTLKLSNNNLTVVPNELFMMPQLEFLSLARNKIVTVGSDQQEDARQPMMVWRCTNLQELNLSYNALTTIPCSLSTACRMRRLDLANNKLTEIPTPWHCPMEMLNLSYNQISGSEDIHIYWRHTLRILHLGRNNLERIPPTICRLTMLENLDLSETQIEELPDKDMWKTFSLSKLDLSYNRLTNNLDDDGMKRNYWFSSHPREVRTLKDLEFPEFFNTNLKVLNLSFNDLREVPKCVRNMRALRYLDIRGNPHISRLPNEMAILRDLRTLKVNPGQIREPFTDVLHQGRQQQRISLEIETVMETLRSQFLKYEACREMKIVLVGPPQSGKTELLSCLTGCDWPYHDSGVNVVRQKTFNFRRNQVQEQQIFFTLWDLKGGEDFLLIHQALLTPRTIYLLVWDIRERDDNSLKRLEPYILNIKARAPSCPIIAVASHIDKYPNQRGLRAKVVQEARHAFLQIFRDVNVNFVEVDARPRSVDSSKSQGADGITDLKLMIYNCATTLKYVKKTGGGCEEARLIDRKVPKSYIDFKKHISIELREHQSVDESVPRTTVPIMTEADAIQIRDILGIPIETSEEVEEVMEFLRDCGILIYIRDYTYKLTRLYFLDPVWLSDTLVKVIRLKNDDSTANEGIVGESQLRQLYANSGFGEGRFKEYLQLLARFEIALSTSRYCADSPILNEAPSYVIPSALPRGRPCMEYIGENPYRHKLMRWYRLAYIPPGFWSRLVARLLVSIKQHTLSYISIQLEHVQTYVSQEGMYIHHEHGHIKIEPMRFPVAPNREEPGLRITLLSKDGTFSPLGFIVDHIEKLIEEWYPGLTEKRPDGSTSIVRLIPCPMCKHSSQNRPQASTSEIHRYHLFTLEELIKAICINGRECIKCPRHPKHPVSLKSLAPDLFLTDLAVEHLREDELILESFQLGRGGFSDVYAAKYCGRSVALKTLLGNHGIEQNQQPTSSSSMSSSNTPRDPCTISLASSGRATDSTISAASKTQESTTPNVTSQPTSETADILQSVVKTYPRLRYEVRMMSKLTHPCVLQLVGVSVQRLAFAMELAPSGDLATYVSDVFKQRRNHFVLEEVVHESVLPRLLSFKIAFQVASVITYLHSMGVIHADIKTNNVLLFSTDIQSSINIKLSDYGISHELDIGGVKGNTVLHAFCAPEIKKGLAFDEKIDWFSFAMFLYHIISGTLPFMNTTSLDTIARVTTGCRPEFDYYNYSMRPQLPHMEGLMKACWKKNPDERPSGKEVLAVMQDISFMCLRRSKLLESEPEAVLYTDAQHDNEELDSTQTYHVYVWHSDGHVVDHDMHTGDNGKVIRVAHQDQGQVLCAFAYDGIHIIGRSNRTIETYSLIQDKLTLQNQFAVPSEPTKLFYTCTEKVDTIHDHAPSPGRLYVGLHDGEVVIFKYKPRDTTIVPVVHEWTKLKTLTLSIDPAPCLCIEPADDRNEIWISCGTILRVLTTSEGLLDPDIISVAPDEDLNSNEKRFVEGLRYSNGSLWCFLSNSCQVVRYDAASRLLEDCFYCGHGLQRPGSCLTNLITSIDATAEIDSSSSDEEGETKRVFHNQHPHPRKNAVDGKEFPHSAAQSAPEIYSPKLNNYDRRHRPLSEGHQLSEESLQVNVSSIVVVQDTLWIGRDRGDILVITLGDDKRSRYQFGEVLAVLEVNPILNLPKGPTKQLLRLGCNRVAEYQHINYPIRDSGRPFRHHLLIWENWGSQDITKAKDLAVISRLESGQ